MEDLFEVDSTSYWKKGDGHFVPRGKMPRWPTQFVESDVVVDVEYLRRRRRRPIAASMPMDLWKGAKMGKKSMKGRQLQEAASNSQHKKE